MNGGGLVAGMVAREESFQIADGCGWVMVSIWKLDRFDLSVM